jgi:hypothetical protein
MRHIFSGRNARLHSYSEYVVLVDADRDLSVPYPSPPELVAVSTLVHEDIPYSQGKAISLLQRYTDRLDLREIQPSTLNVRDPQIWDFDQFLIVLAFAADLDPALDIGHFA